MTDRTPTPPDIVFLLSKEGDNIRFDAARRDPAGQGAWLIDRLGALNVAQVQNAQRTIQAEYAAAVGEQLEGDAVVRWLVDWGRRTWGLLPLEFRERFYPNFMAGGRATTLQILADGPTIWWEIALAEGGEASPGAPLDAMLGRRFGIGRWHRLPGDLLREADIDRLLATIPPSFQVTDAAVFVGPEIDAQVRLDTRIERFFGVPRTNPGQPLQFLDLVDDDRAMAIDVLAHGTPALIRLHGLAEAPEDLAVTTVTGLGNEFTRPTIVVLHACNTGQATDASALDDWLDALIGHLKCRVVVAPPVPIDHVAALRLACQFYPRLAAGTPVGTALMDARSALSASDRSAAIYQCHGHCNSVVTFDVPTLGVMVADCLPFSFI